MTTTEPELRPDDAPAIDEPTQFRISVLRHTGAALLIISAVALAFWGLGNQQPPTRDVASEPRGEVVIGGPAQDSDESATDVPDDPEDVEVGDDGDDGEEGVAASDGDPAGDAQVTDPEDPATGDGGAGDGDTQPGSNEPTSEQTPEVGDDQDDAAEAGTGDDEGTQPEPSTDDQAVDPATVTVQVLDGYQQDGGAAADAVADAVTDAGYNLVARNPALLYDVTTVLYNAGSEDAAAQVAALIGTDSIREQPGNLSTQVAIHIVVGADRG